MPLVFDDSQNAGENKGAPTECAFIASSAPVYTELYETADGSGLQRISYTKPKSDPTNGIPVYHTDDHHYENAESAPVAVVPSRSRCCGSGRY